MCKEQELNIFYDVNDCTGEISIDFVAGHTMAWFLPFNKE